MQTKAMSVCELDHVNVDTIVQEKAVAFLIDAKLYHRLSRNYLKTEAGDHANVVLAASGYNLAKLLAWFYWQSS